MDERRRAIAAKYDRGAATYSSRYADARAWSAFFIARIEGWGTPVAPGASILEISCADGFMTQSLVERGYDVTGLDLSPKMVEVATRRLDDVGLQADLRVADANTFEPDRMWDVLLAPMATFYRYIDDPLATLTRLAPAITTKAFVDLNPRELDPAGAVDDLRLAGFVRDAAWQPVYVPHRIRIGRGGRWALRTLGAAPPIRSALLRRKFNVLATGSKPDREGR